MNKMLHIDLSVFIQKENKELHMINHYQIQYKMVITLNNNFISYESYQEKIAILVKRN